MKNAGLVLGFTLVASTAIAQPAPPPVQPPAPAGAPAYAPPVITAPRATRFSLLEHPSGHSFVAGDLGLGFFVGDDNDTGFGDVVTTRVNLNGAYMFNPQFGITGSLPLIFAFDGDNDEQGVGGLEVGGVFVVSLAPESKVVLQGRLTLPTADDNGVGFLGLFTRVNDVSQALPETTALSLLGSFVGRSGRMVEYRIDTGVVLPIDQPSGLDTDPLLKLNAGVAIGQGTTRFLIELANLINSDDVGDGDSWLTQGGAGIAYSVGNIDFTGGIYTFLDALDDDLVPFGINLTVGRSL